MQRIQKMKKNQIMIEKPEVQEINMRMQKMKQIQRNEREMAEIEKLRK